MEKIKKVSVLLHSAHSGNISKWKKRVFHSTYKSESKYPEKQNILSHYWQEQNTKNSTKIAKNISCHLTRYMLHGRMKLILELMKKFLSRSTDQGNRKNNNNNARCPCSVDSFPQKALTFVRAFFARGRKISMNFIPYPSGRIRTPLTQYSQIVRWRFK